MTEYYYQTRNGKKIKVRKGWKKKNRNEDLAKGAAYAGGSAIALKAGVESGAPRLLDVRLERHSSSKANAKKILDEGGFLDVNKSNSGAMRQFETAKDTATRAQKIKESVGYNYISGSHPKQTLKFSPIGKAHLFPDVPIFNNIYRKLQALNYRSKSGIDYDKHKTQLARQNQARLKAIPAMLGLEGKTMYVPVTDKQVVDNFIPDPYDFKAIRTKAPVKVYGNRFEAVKAALKERGKAGVKLNKSRVGSGALILGGGTAIAATLAKSSYDKFKGVKRKSRKKT